MARPETQRRKEKRDTGISLISPRLCVSGRGIFPFCSALLTLAHDRKLI